MSTSDFPGFLVREVNDALESFTDQFLPGIDGRHWARACAVGSRLALALFHESRSRASPGTPRSPSPHREIYTNEMS